MRYRLLGQTSLNVSLLGLGTVKLGRDLGVKYPEQFRIPDDREALQLLNQARDLGINLIDTAPAYGNSEERLGHLLKGQRNDWLICTKAGEEFSVQNGEGVSSYYFTEEHLRFSVERSLQRLNTDVLDIVLIHSNGDDEQIIQQHGALEVLAELKSQGKIRAIGMSTKTVAGGLLAAEQADVVMVTYNLNEQGEQAVLDYCQQNHKGCLIKKAFASGHLPTNSAEATVTTDDPVQQSLDFVFNHPAVSSAIVGTINPQHLQHNVDCALKSTRQAGFQ